jgi:hypothetical protein
MGRDQEARMGVGEGGKGKGRMKRLSGVEKLVVTLWVHVCTELGDGDVLNLTRWVWEAHADGGGNGDGDEGPEVTAGVDRG